jgi:hypothetical protein
MSNSSAKDNDVVINVTPSRATVSALDELQAYLNACKAVKQDLGVDTTSIDVNAALIGLYKEFKASMNMSLKKAESDRIAVNMIGQYLGKSQDERYVVPFCGRGGGRDCKPRAFYRGNGFPLPVDDLIQVCGVVTTCEEMVVSAKITIREKVAIKQKRGVSATLMEEAEEFMKKVDDDGEAVVGPPAAKRTRVEPSMVDLASLDEANRHKVLGYISGLKSAEDDAGGKPSAK